MTRRKTMAQREPNGRVARVPTISASEAKRLRDAALSGMRDPLWGTELGRLYLIGRITAGQFAAGKKWAEMADLYRHVIDSPALDPKAMDLDRAGGSRIDPDSYEGQREAKRHKRAAESFYDAHMALKTVGRKIDDVNRAIKDGLTLRTLLSERTVRELCEQNVAPAGAHELSAASTGLYALASFWGLTDSRKSMSDRHS